MGNMMSKGWTRWLPLITGVLFIALVGAGIGLTWNTPDTKDAATKVLAYYQMHKHRVMLGSYLIALGVFFGLFFFGALRDFLRRGTADRLATVAFGGGILFAVAGGLVSGTGFALADQPHVMSAQTAQALNLLGSNLLAPLLLASLGVVLFATGLGIVCARLMPRWTGWLAMACGVVSLTPIGWLMMVALALLVITIGIRMATAAVAPMDDSAKLSASMPPEVSVGA